MILALEHLSRPAVFAERCARASSPRHRTKMTLACADAPCAGTGRSRALPDQPFDFSVPQFDRQTAHPFSVARPRSPLA
jgi:hypothetical protein